MFYDQDVVHEWWKLKDLFHDESFYDDFLDKLNISF